MDPPSGSVHSIRTFDYYDSHGNKIVACVCAVSMIVPQIDSKFCIASPYSLSYPEDKRIFSVITNQLEIPVLPDLPNGQFYMRIRRKRDAIVDDIIHGLEHEYAEDKCGDAIPMTIRTIQEMGLGDEDIPCYDELNFQLLVEQGIIRVIGYIYKNKKAKVVQVEMLLSSDEMIRWCENCFKLEDLANMNERFMACEGCMDYQRFYFCSKTCHLRCWTGKGEYSQYAHNTMCGYLGKALKKVTRGDFFILPDEEIIEPELELELEPKPDEIFRLLLPSYYYGLESLESY